MLHVAFLKESSNEDRLPVEGNYQRLVPVVARSLIAAQIVEVFWCVNKHNVHALLLHASVQSIQTLSIFFEEKYCQVGVLIYSSSTGGRGIPIPPAARGCPRPAVRAT